MWGSRVALRRAVTTGDVDLLHIYHRARSTWDNRSFANKNVQHVSKLVKSSYRIGRRRRRRRRKTSFSCAIIYFSLKGCVTDLILLYHAIEGGDMMTKDYIHTGITQYKQPIPSAAAAVSIQPLLSNKTIIIRIYFYYVYTSEYH